MDCGPELGTSLGPLLMCHSFVAWSTHPSPGRGGRGPVPNALAGF